MTRLKNLSSFVRDLARPYATYAAATAFALGLFHPEVTEGKLTLCVTLLGAMIAARGVDKYNAIKAVRLGSDPAAVATATGA